MDLLLAATFVLILGAEFVNGWTDAPNSIATVIGTRALRPIPAVVMAAILNVVGVMSGTAVAATIGKGIIDPKVVDLVTILGAMTSIIIWSTIAAQKGLPTSESHALVSGLAGAGLATAGPAVLVFSGWEKVGLGLVLSTFLGAGLGFAIVKLVMTLFRSASPVRARRRFGRMQIFSAAFMAFNHGSNDGQKFMGVFAMALVLGGLTSEFVIPWWVILLCGAVMGLGTSIGGWRIIRTMGIRMAHLETYQGFAAETGAASTIFLASHLGVPLSTTHTIGTALMGVGAARGLNGVRWVVAREIVTAWVLTFPICFTISFVITMLLRAVLR